MIEFDFVPFHNVAQEIAPNVGRHYSEMTDGDDYGIPNIDWDYYLDISLTGNCVVVTARDAGKLIGYSVYSVNHNPRYKHILEASSDGIFLEKPYRGELSRQFIKKADEYLKGIGVQETNYVLSDDRVGRLLGGSGYESKYKVWSVKYGQ